MEDNAEVPFFEGSFNNLFPSDSGLHDGYTEYTQNKRKREISSFCQKCNVPLHAGICDEKYHTLIQH